MQLLNVSTECTCWNLSHHCCCIPTWSRSCPPPTGKDPKLPTKNPQGPSPGPSFQNDLMRRQGVCRLKYIQLHTVCASVQTGSSVVLETCDVYMVKARFKHYPETLIFPGKRSFHGISSLIAERLGRSHSPSQLNHQTSEPKARVSRQHKLCRTRWATAHASAACFERQALWTLPDI